MTVAHSVMMSVSEGVFRAPIDLLLFQFTAITELTRQILKKQEERLESLYLDENG